MDKRIEICKKDKDNKEYKDLLKKLDYSNLEEKEDYIRKILNTKLTPKKDSLDDLKLRVAEKGIVVGKSSKKELLELLGEKVSNKKVKDPNEPKRPLTSFFRFSRDKKAEILKKNLGIKSIDISKLCGKLWEDLDSEEKEKYDSKYKEEFAKYKEEYNKYKGIEEKDPNAPKKPLTSYLRYCAQHRETLKGKNPNLKPGEISDLLKDNWNKLDEKEKEKYKKEYENEMKEFKKNLKMLNHLKRKRILKMKNKLIQII